MKSSEMTSAEKTVGTLEVDDAIVLLLGAPSDNPSLQGRLQGVTKLEKLMFLLDQETAFAELMKEDMQFTPHNFGPFSSKIYQMVDVLAAAGLVEDSARVTKNTEDSWESSELIGRSVDPYATRDFYLTPRGEKYYQALLRELPEGVVDAVSKLKDRFGSI